MELKNKNKALRRFKSGIVYKRRKAYTVARSRLVRGLGKVLKTPSICSCALCCANPRKTFGYLTRQEEVHVLNLKEGLALLGGRDSYAIDAFG